jgi:hypothetical protein
MLPNTYSGEIAYIYAFDIAYELRCKVATLLGQTVTETTLDPSKRTPRQSFLYRSQMVNLPDVHVDVDRESKRVPAKRTVRLLPTGAVSITFRVPFAHQTLEDLVPYHVPSFGVIDLQEQARVLARQITVELGDACVRPHLDLPAEEAYTVFCIHNPPDNAQEWLQANRRGVAALLTQEENPADLAAEEIDESIHQRVSYYRQDIAVIDWDAALLIDTPRNLLEALHVIELANLQLAELEAFDRLLDRVLDRAYRDVQSRRTRVKKDILKELKEIRMDMARFGDELSNATKFLGDWHYARVYQLLSRRFHLSEWQQTITNKQRTLDDLYQLLQNDQNHRLMTTLEAAVVLMFLIEILPTLWKAYNSLLGALFSQ